MARRVYADFDAELELRLANRSDVTSTMRGFFLNDAYQRIVNQFPHPEFQKTETGTVALAASSYSFTATDVFYPEFVKDTTNQRVVDYQSLMKIESQRQVSGPITEYYFFANTLYFDRTADAATAIKIWYKGFPAQWTTGSPAFNPIFDVCLPMLAAKIGYETIGNQQAAHIQETEYNNYTSAMLFAPAQATKNDRRQSIKVRMK